MREKRELSDWIARDPRARKWMVSCMTCGRVGFEADSPEEFFNRYWLERLGPLRISDDGRCQECVRAADRDS